MIRHEANLGWVEFTQSRPETLAPTFEVGFVMRHEMGEGREPFGRGSWIKDDLNEPKKSILFDNDNRTGRGHRLLRFGSGFGIDLERFKEARQHVVCADQQRQLDSLTLCKMNPYLVEHCVRYINVTRDRIRVSE